MDLDDLRRKLRGQPSVKQEADALRTKEKALKFGLATPDNTDAAKIAKWLTWRDVVGAGKLEWAVSCPWCQAPAFVSEKHGKACSKPACGRRWDGPNIECEHCKRPGIQASLTPAATMYEDDGDAPLVLCEACAKEYNDYWQEQWDEYNAGRL